MVVFDRQWFKKYQRIILVFANTWAGRWFFKIYRDVPKGKRLIEITSNSFTWQERINGKDYLTTDFRTHDKFTKRLYYGLKPLWHLLHFLDSLLKPLSQFGLKWNFGFDTLTAYTTRAYLMPQDGVVGRTDVAEYFNVIKTGAGTYANQDNYDNDLFASLFTGPTTNTFTELKRSIFTFDTAAIGSASFIHSAVFSVHALYFTNNLGLSPQHSGLSLVSASPQLFYSIRPSDYSTFGSVRLADDVEGSYDDRGEIGMNYTLNNAGKNNIVKDGVSGFGLRLAVDVDGGQPNWQGGSWAYWSGYFADFDGSTPDPRLVVTYLPPMRDNISLFDDFSKTADKISGESIAMQEYPFKNAQKGFSETIALEGNAEICFTLLLPEALAVSEILSKKINKNIIDGIAVSEGQKRTGQRTASDEIALAESLNIIPVLVQDAADYMTLAEKFYTGMKKEFAEVVVIEDHILKSAERGFCDNISLADSLSFFKYLPLELADAIALSGDTGKTSVKKLDSQLIIQESIAASSFITAAETLQLQDAVDVKIAGWSREKDIPVGAAPIWILKLPFASGAVYVSDIETLIENWEGGIATKPWVSDWGQIDEDIAGELSSTKVSDFTINVINDPNAASNIESMLWNPSNSPAVTDCELYLWFRGLDAYYDPPRKIWAGNIIDFQKENELKYRIQFADQSVKVDKYIGNKIDKNTYPNADPDDVGKVANIIYGDVSKVPALAVEAGAMTSLPNTINESQTSFKVSDGSRLSAGKVVKIDDEEIYISGISGDNIASCSRGFNGTIPERHLRGAAAWEKKDRFVYLFADHPVKSIDKVYGKVGAVDLDVTSICGIYTGKQGSELSGYSGKAVISMPGYITTSQAVDLLVNDGIAVNDAIAVIDSIAVNDQITVYDTIGVVDSIGVNDTIGVSNPSHTHSASGGISGTMQQYSLNLPEIYLSKNGSFLVFPIFINFAAVSNMISANYSISFQLTYLTQSGVTMAATINNLDIMGRSSIQFSTGPQDSIPIWIGWSGDNVWGDYWIRLKILSAQRTVYMGTAISSETQWSSKSGSAYKSGAASKSGGAGKSGGAYKSGSSYKSGSAYKSGTVTLSGSSVANTLVGDAVIISGKGWQDDADGKYTGSGYGLIERPDHVVKHFLKTYGAWNTEQFYTDAGNSLRSKGYKFAAVINEYKKLKEHLANMAFQSRCYFRFAKGRAELLFRPDYKNSKKTILKDMVRMNSDNTTTTKGPNLVPLIEVLNKINLHFDRDWAQSGDGAYKQAVKTEDSISIAKYGEKENPGLFYFDFVKDLSMANSLAAFYLARYKDRKKILQMEVFLDNIELMFSDGIGIEGYTGVWEIQKFNIFPGSGEKMRNDKILIEAREY